MNRLPILAALVLAASPPLFAQAPEADLCTRLEKEVPRLMREGDVPGLSIAVLRDGRTVWTGALGVANPSGGARVTPDTVFQAASLSKPVFSYVVLRLADRGVIDLDRPLAAYLPHPRLKDERARRITARMVLSHTTGLPNWEFGDGPIPLRFTPGESWGYSGEAFVYLQKVAEALTGLPLDDLARREVFEPLGMTRSNYVWKPAFEADAAAGVDESGAVRPTDRGQKANAAASLLTTAGDYARFLTAVLEGRGLKPETRRAWLDPQSQV
ncbi:MAG: serine hydrolase domain-containing protein, partial [Acidobacteriota bacterium]